MILLIVTGFCHPLPVLARASWASPAACMCSAASCCSSTASSVSIMAFFVKSSPTGGTREQVTRLQDLAAPGRQPPSGWARGSSYYLFLKKDHPLGAKLGVPQKISYLLIPILIIVMFYTGLCLWAPDDGPRVLRGRHRTWWAASCRMRIIHYFMMYVFICLHAHPHLPGQHRRHLADAASCSSGRSTAAWSTSPEKHNDRGRGTTSGINLVPLAVRPAELLDAAGRSGTES